MSVKVSRILHAGYIFEADNQRIAFDPIFENPFSTNCQAFPNVDFDKKAIQEQKFDAVIISDLPSCKVQRINPRESYLLTKNSFTATERLIWIKPIDDQNVDYNYNPIPQAVKEIAKHFPELTDKEKQLITNYCNNDLKQIFYFKLEADNLTSTTETLAEWTTETPAYKLLTEITKGEQLTSRYLQINSENFSNDQKESLKKADPLADPLLRILSSRSITSFHKHQLSLLKK